MRKVKIIKDCRSIDWQWNVVKHNAGEIIEVTDGQLSAIMYQDAGKILL